eukprot:TRINITY_DN8458_c0_g3_i1.p1 TRINITY_DN8458_c0_g3~~TRINITY_DN8458_c0_g3_i1.p1  ORF type:complete len:218 (-),score=81.89 TRINITY_DN8458_c0_g3_i1:425-1078(-)
MGASLSMCSTAEDGCVNDLQEQDITNSSQKDVVQMEEAAVEAAAADIKAETVSLAEDAKPGTIAQKVEEATAAAAEESKKTAENTQFGKPAEDGNAAAAASEGKPSQVGLTDVTARVEAPLVMQSLVVVFEQCGKQTEVRFEKRPLGFEVREARKGGCCVAAPRGKFVVAKVANADLKAVKVGMSIKRIGDQDVPASKDLSELREMLGLAEKALPEA